MDIGQRLKQLREENRLDQVQAAKVADTTKQAVSQIENGRTKVPGGAYLLRWAKHYKVDLEWLITGKGSQSSSSQPVRPSPEIILAAVRLACGATDQAGVGHFDIETREDAELFALAIEEALDENLEIVSDSDVQRFAHKITSRREGSSGQERTVGQDGRADRSAGQEEDGEAARPAAGRARKRA